MPSNRLAVDADFHARVKGAEFEDLAADLSRGELLFVRETHFGPVSFAGLLFRPATGVIGGAAGKTLSGVKRGQFHLLANSHEDQGNDMSPSRSAAQIVIPVLLWLADPVIHALAGQLAQSEETVRSYQAQITELNGQIDNLKLSFAFSGAGDTVLAKERIDKLVREIDKCIKLLEKES